MAKTTYYWDDLSDNVVLEEDENGDPIAEYVQEPELYGEAISQQRDGQVRYYNYDGLGDTSELTDENQDVTDTYEYSAFGEEVAHTGTTENPFRYKGALGYYTDAETDDVYVRARKYEPRIARWISLDPVGFIDGLNRYVYIGNTPLRNGDPSGLKEGIMNDQEKSPCKRTSDWKVIGEPDIKPYGERDVQESLPDFGVDPDPPPIRPEPTKTIRCIVRRKMKITYECKCEYDCKAQLVTVEKTQYTVVHAVVERTNDFLMIAGRCIGLADFFDDLPPVSLPDWTEYCYYDFQTEEERERARQWCGQKTYKLKYPWPQPPQCPESPPSTNNDDE